MKTSPRNFALGTVADPILFSLLALILAFFAHAPAAEPGTSTSSLVSGPQVSDEAGGYSFSTPLGWVNNKILEGYTVINPMGTIAIAIKVHDYKDFQAFSSNLGLAEIGFEIISGPHDFGGSSKWFRAAKRVDANISVMDTFVLFSPYGGGVFVTVFSDKPDSETALLTTYAIAKSVRFGERTKPMARIDQPQEPTANPGWQNYLQGKQLVYYKTSGSFSDRINIHLCSSGVFYKKINSSDYSNGGGGVLSGASGNTITGTWRVLSGSMLVLQSENGEVKEYRLAERQSGGGISLNGNRYFVRSDATCR